MNTNQNKQKGGILIIFAVAIIPIILMLGSAIDLSRTSIIKEKAQYALDLAGIAMVNSDEALSNKILKDYFYANYQDEDHNSKRHFGKTTKLSYKYITKDELELEAIVKIPTIFLSIVGIGETEVRLKSTVLGKNANIELVMVLDNTNSMDDDNKMDTLKTISKDFTRFLFDGEAVNNKVKVGLVPFADNVNVGTDSSIFPQKYLEIRGGSFSGSIWKRSSDIWRSDTTDSISPKWEGFTKKECFPRVWSENICVLTPILPLTNIRSKVLSRLDEMSAIGGTDVHLGVAWGWRVLSSKAPYTNGAKSSDNKWRKFLVILTDGENSSNNHWTYNRRFTGEDWDESLTRTCDNIKRVNITIFTIGFDVATPKILSLLKNCASKTNYYFKAESKSDLKNAFDEIKRSLSNIVIKK
jgi:Mg-chelatase subunit ChlD